jgi:hypothetical protein
LWGDFVNAVTSVVQTAVGEIVSLVSMVYNSVVEAYTFVAHLAREAADLGGQLLSRAAATLVSVGEALYRLVEAALDYLIDLAEAALVKLFDPLIAMIQGYQTALVNAANATVADVSEGYPVTTPHVQKLFSAMSGAVLTAALAIGVAVTVILLVFSEFDIFESVVVGLILSILVVTSAPYLETAVSEITILSASAIWAVDHVVNLTFNGAKALASQVDWKALVESVETATGFTGTSLAFWLMCMEPSPEDDDGGSVLPLVAFVFSVLGLICSLGGWLDSSTTAIALAFMFSLFGEGVAFAAILVQQTELLRSFDGLDLGLASVSFGTAEIDYSSTF